MKRNIKNESNIGDIRTADFFYEPAIFVGCDPGLINPCIAALSQDGEVLCTKFIDGKEFKGDTYARAYQIGMQMVKLITGNFHNCKAILVIEGSPFIRNSRSIESMAQCRQAIYDCFETHMNERFVGFHEPKPSQVKQIASKKGASKEDVFQAVNTLYPHLFDMCETHRYITKGKHKGKKQLLHNIEATADAVAIALAGIRAFDGGGLN
jgi:hypothetical protein